MTESAVTVTCIGCGLDYQSHALIGSNTRCPICKTRNSITREHRPRIVKVNLSWLKVPTDLPKESPNVCKQCEKQMIWTVGCTSVQCPQCGIVTVSANVTAKLSQLISVPKQRVSREDKIRTEHVFKQNQRIMITTINKARTDLIQAANGYSDDDLDTLYGELDYYETDSNKAEDTETLIVIRSMFVKFHNEYLWPKIQNLSSMGIVPMSTTIIRGEIESPIKVSALRHNRENTRIAKRFEEITGRPLTNGIITERVIAIVQQYDGYSNAS